MGFTIYNYEVACEALDPIRLPEYTGSTLRGSFGHGLRKAVCSRRNETCDQCPIRYECVYAQVFETPVPHPEQVPYYIRFAPHPFILSPIIHEGGLLKPKQRFSFQLKVIGSWDKYLHHIINGLMCAAGRGLGAGRGRFRVVHVSDKQSHNVVYRDGYLSYRKGLKITGVATEAIPHYLHVKLVTPLRLIEKKRLLLDLTAQQLLRAMVRRVRLVDYFHGDGTPIVNGDYREQLKKVKMTSDITPYCWRRRSARQKRMIRMDGVIGSITLNHLTPFLEKIVRICELIHFGKGSSFGLGQIKILGA